MPLDQTTDDSCESGTCALSSAWEFRILRFALGNCLISEFKYNYMWQNTDDSPFYRCFESRRWNEHSIFVLKALVVASGRPGSLVITHHLLSCHWSLILTHASVHRSFLNQPVRASHPYLTSRGPADCRFVGDYAAVSISICAVSSHNCSNPNENVKKPFMALAWVVFALAKQRSANFAIFRLAKCQDG